MSQELGISASGAGVSPDGVKCFGVKPSGVVQ